MTNSRKPMVIHTIMPDSDGSDGSLFLLPGRSQVDRVRLSRLVTRIVSGGQAGADRAALDWAIAHGIPHGGWCPPGRMAEDGVIDARYKLSEILTGGARG